MEGDGCAARRAGAFLHGIFRTAVTGPVDRRSALLVGEGVNLHQGGDHKGGVEAKSKMSDNGIFCRFLILFHKFCGARKCNLIDVLLDFLVRHANSIVGDGDELILRI